MPDVDVIYKICSKDEWKAAQLNGSYNGSLDDKRDGFIHFSTFDQHLGTLDKHFKGQKDLLLLKVKISQLDPKQLKWEISNHGDKFPHLYGELPLDAVIDLTEISINNIQGSIK